MIIAFAECARRNAPVIIKRESYDVLLFDKCVPALLKQKMEGDIGSVFSRNSSFYSDSRSPSPVSTNSSAKCRVQQTVEIKYLLLVFHDQHSLVDSSAG